jgi:SAM-dependent methyltransferase
VGVVGRGHLRRVARCGARTRSGTPCRYFCTTTTAPHLPFEDGYFDLIYAGSVFTHIADLADAWFLELKRIVRPGGRLYITVHDKHTIDLALNHPDPPPFYDSLLPYYKKENIGELDFDMFTIKRSRLTIEEHAQVGGSEEVVGFVLETSQECRIPDMSGRKRFRLCSSSSGEA